MTKQSSPWRAEVGSTNILLDSMNELLPIDGPPAHSWTDRHFSSYELKPIARLQLYSPAPCSHSSSPSGLLVSVVMLSSKKYMPFNVIAASRNARLKAILFLVRIHHASTRGAPETSTFERLVVFARAAFYQG